GREVREAHHGLRHVRADRDRPEIEGTQPAADLLEDGRVVARVPREVEAPVLPQHRPARPEPTVLVEQGAGAPVLRWHAHDGPALEGAAVPPVELVDVVDAELA